MESKKLEKLAYDYHQFGTAWVGFSVVDDLKEAGLVCKKTGLMTIEGMGAKNRHIERCSK